MKKYLLTTIALLLLCGLPLTAAVGTESAYDSLSQVGTKELMEKGRKHFEKREASQALACFVIVKERLKNSDSNEDMKLYIRALNNCACVLRYFYFDYANAFENFTQAYDLCEEYHYREFLPVIMVNMGDLINDYGASYHSESLLQQAHDIFDECMDHAVKDQNWDLMMTAFFNLANQNYTLPLEKYRVIFSEAVPDSTPDLEFIRQLYLGLEQFQQHRYAEARQHFERQLEVVSARWEPERDTLSAYMSIARTYQQEGNYAEETAYLQRAYQKAEETNVSDQSVNILEMLAESYGRQGLTEEQQYYHQRYLEKKEEAHASQLASIGEMSYVYKLKREEANALKAAERHRQQQMLFAAVALVLLVIVVMAVLLWRKNRMLYLRTKVLYDKNREVLRMERETQLLRKKEFEEKKYSRSSLSTEQKEALIYRIEEALSKSEELCQLDFTLAKLTKIVDSNTTYVSQVINEHYGTAFSNVLASHRVREACRRISDETEQYAQLTIEAIAMSVGFKSRTSFINAFKREVGLTPSEYLRIAMKKDTE